ncbi:glycoside hydrolase family 30 protein [Kocuria sabuli]|uniref:glycoside hydrolase family 30 protein n=1 Tax=Kocuria sabuli TaxID=3071448 RepID=UPI0034D6D2D6
MRSPLRILGPATTVVVAVALSIAVPLGMILAMLLPGAQAASSGPRIDWVVTTGDQASLAAPRPVVSFGRDKQAPAAVVVDDSTRHQRFVGVGAAMTESSAWLLSRLPAETRSAALRELFHPTEGAGISVVRVPLGASDFALDDYTYDDLPDDETDPGLYDFSVAREHEHVVPLLREAQAVNPSLRLVLSAWSPPAWMKDSGTTHGGSLLARYESLYAGYLARAAAGFTAAGLDVAAMTVVNEPHHSTADYPSTWMPVEQQVRVATALRTELDTRGLTAVAILAHDHNWDDAAAPVEALATAPAGTYAGAAFHCYAGDVSAQSAVVEAAPQAKIWTMECTGGGWSSGFSGDLRWGMRNMLIGAFRNHSQAVLWWNIALDPASGPKNGGCQDCRGVLTVDPGTASVDPTTEYWLLAHVGRHLPRGSERVASTGGPHGVETAAFLTPENRHVMLLLNDTATEQTVTVRWNGQAARLSLPAESVATATW